MTILIYLLMMSTTIMYTAIGYNNSITAFTEIKIIKDGEDVILECQNNITKENCYWEKNDNPLDIKGRYNYINEHTRSTLNLTTNQDSLTKDCSIIITTFNGSIDSGLWSCKTIHGSDTSGGFHIKNYTLQSQSINDPLFKSAKENENYLLIYINVAIGGIVIVIIVITAVCVIIKKTKSKNNSLESESAVPVSSNDETLSAMENSFLSSQLIPVRKHHQTPRKCTCNLKRKSMSVGCLNDGYNRSTTYSTMPKNPILKDVKCFVSDPVLDETPESPWNDGEFYRENPYDSVIFNKRQTLYEQIHFRNSSRNTKTYDNVKANLSQEHQQRKEIEALYAQVMKTKSTNNPRDD